jgi:hypothetical protein
MIAALRRQGSTAGDFGAGARRGRHAATYRIAFGSSIVAGAALRHVRDRSVRRPADSRALRPGGRSGESRNPRRARQTFASYRICSPPRATTRRPRAAQARHARERCAVATSRIRAARSTTRGDDLKRPSKSTGRSKSSRANRAIARRYRARREAAPAGDAAVAVHSFCTTRRANTTGRRR